MIEPTVHILKEKCTISNLDSSYRISILLPSDYQNSNSFYPVLYLLGGENLVDATSYSLSKKLFSSKCDQFDGIIIVQIDSEEQVKKDYSPYYNPHFGDGLGKEMLNFLMENVIPEINNEFRVKVGPANTAIGGGYIAGLLSLYAGLKHGSVFGKVLAFSPSLWVSPIVYHDLDQLDQSECPVKIYLCSGRGESRFYFSNVLRLKRILERKTRICSHIETMFSSTNQQDEHTVFSQESFCNAILWLFC